MLAVEIGIHDRRRKAALLRCLHRILDRHDRPDHLESGLRQRGLDIETYFYLARSRIGPIFRFLSARTPAMLNGDEGNRIPSVMDAKKQKY